MAWREIGPAKENIRVILRAQKARCGRLHNACPYSFCYFKMSCDRFSRRQFFEHVTTHHVQFSKYRAQAAPKPFKGELVLTLKRKGGRCSSPHRDYPFFKNTQLTDKKLNLYKKLALNAGYNVKPTDENFVYIHIRYVEKELDVFCCTLCPELFGSASTIERHMLYEHLKIDREVPV